MHVGIVFNSFKEKQKHVDENCEEKLMQCSEVVRKLLKEKKARKVTFTKDPNAWIENFEDMISLINERKNEEEHSYLLLVELHHLEDIIRELSEDILIDVAEWIENEEGIDKELVLMDKGLKERVYQATTQYLSQFDREKLIYVRIDIIMKNGYQLGYEVKDTQHVESIKKQYFERLDEELGDYVPFHVRSFLDTPIEVLASHVRDVAETLHLSLEDALYEEGKRYHITKAVERVLSNQRTRPPRFLQVPSKIYLLLLKLKEAEGYIS